MIKVNVKTECTSQPGSAVYCEDCNSYACDCFEANGDVRQVTYVDKDDAYMDRCLTGAENQYRTACAKSAIEYGEEV